MAAHIHVHALKETFMTIRMFPLFMMISALSIAAGPAHPGGPNDGARSSDGGGSVGAGQAGPANHDRQSWNGIAARRHGPELPALHVAAADECNRARKRKLSRPVLGRSGRHNRECDPDAAPIVALVGNEPATDSRPPRDERASPGPGAGSSRQRERPVCVHSNADRRDFRRRRKASSICRRGSPPSSA